MHVCWYSISLFESFDNHCIQNDFSTIEICTYYRVGQDQVSVEFLSVLTTHIWIQVKGKDKVCCLKHFGEYAEAYQKAKSLVQKHFFSHQPQQVSKKPFFKRYLFALRILKDFIFVVLFYYSVHTKATYLTLWTDDSPLSRSLNEQSR